MTVAPSFEYRFFKYIKTIFLLCSRRQAKENRLE